MNQVLKSISLLSALTLLVACGGDDSAPARGASAPDHAAEARETITADNMDQHLEALEAEIAAGEEAIDD